MNDAAARRNESALASIRRLLDDPVMVETESGALVPMVSVARLRLSPSAARCVATSPTPKSF